MKNDDVHINFVIIGKKSKIKKRQEIKERIEKLEAMLRAERSEDYGKWGGERDDF